MKHSVVVLLVALLAAPALAGCLGGDDAPKSKGDDGVCDAKTDPSCDPDAKITEGLGGIKGTILDETLEPVVGANVTLRENALTKARLTVTNDKGVYAFNNLEPGEYTIFAIKDPTHRSNVLKVNVVANQHAAGDIRLDLAPPPVEPYNYELQFVGMIGCSFAHHPFEGKDQCAEQSGIPLDANAATVKEWTIGPYMTSLVVRLESTGGVTGNMDLTLAWPSHGKGLDSIRGPSPLEHTYQITEETAWPTWGEAEQDLRAKITASKDAGSPQLAYQQRFTLDLGLFFHGQPVPPNYVPGQG